MPGEVSQGHGQPWEDQHGRQQLPKPWVTQWPPVQDRRPRLPTGPRLPPSPPRTPQARGRGVPGKGGRAAEAAPSGSPSTEHALPSMSGSHGRHGNFLLLVSISPRAGLSPPAHLIETNLRGQGLSLPPNPPPRKFTWSQLQPHRPFHARPGPLRQPPPGKCALLTPCLRVPARHGAARCYRGRDG